jgi:glutathione synthase/RimK-type ligase-like ATP-grasp enzyme
MIVLVGTPSEPPVAGVAEEAERLGVESLILSEVDAASWNLCLDATAGGPPVARASHGGREVNLDAATGVYLRITSPRNWHTLDPLSSSRHDAALALICSWAESADLRVANRPSAMASNISKPYQAALIRGCGFPVPETLVTNDPAEVRRFHRRHGRVIYKSISGVRSIVRELTPDRAANLDRVRNLPTQFQQLLPGTNVRVHVMGSDVHTCEIDSETIDYRYRDGGAGATMRPVELPSRIRDRCLALSAALDLPLAGIDLLRDSDGQWWCFEVNPSPAYTCFSELTGQPMAASLTRWLAGL